MPSPTRRQPRLHLTDRLVLALDLTRDTQSMRTVRIFIASSRELADERKALPAMIGRIAARPDIRRNYRLDVVRWEYDAAGSAAQIQDAIDRAIDFETLDVVLLFVWNKVGPGTVHEYDRALRLWRAHKRPAMYAFFKQPTTVEARALEAIDRFEQRLTDDGVIPTKYESLETLERLLLERLPDTLPRVVRSTDIDTGAMARVVGWTAVLTVAAAIVTIGLVQSIGYPDGGVTYRQVLMTLILPVIVFFASSTCLLMFYRLLNAFRRAWHSPEWNDDRLYEAFRRLVPRWALPARLASRFPAGVEAGVTTSLALLLVLVSPPVALYDALFGEIVQWRITQSWTPGEGIEQGFATWFLGYTRQDTSPIYVYFPVVPPDRKDHPRPHLGPEVFPPWQTWGYLGLFVGSVLGSIEVIRRLVLFRHEFSDDGGGGNAHFTDV
jgi:hypothetical protein